MQPWQGLRLTAIAAALWLAGCAGNEAPPPPAAEPKPPAPLSEVDAQRQQLEKLQLSLTLPLSPSFVPVLMAGGPPEQAPAVASLTLCKSVAEAKRKGRPATVHGYCIEAYKDGRRTVHPVF